MLCQLRLRLPLLWGFFFWINKTNALYSQYAVPPYLEGSLEHA